jgi:hypothetical protein
MKTVLKWVGIMVGGLNPAGHTLLDPMASAASQHLALETDDELTAIFLYLQSLEPLQAGYK